MSKKESKLEKEYLNLFGDLNQDYIQRKHEWVKKGDSFKQFSVYTDKRTPVLSPNTKLIENSFGDNR